jgi:hypothetical protein
MRLRVRQYVYFTVQSSRMPAADMTAVMGMDPDEITVRASRRMDPPVPRWHAWKVQCDERGLRVDEQVECVITRLRPVERPLRTLLERLHAQEGEDAGATLMVVPYLDDEDGEADEWQHRLLGWHLSPETLRFIVAMDALLVADEYGRDSD